MFRRFAKSLKYLLPLSAGIATHLSLNPLLSLNTKPQSTYDNSKRINIISDISEYS